MSGGPQFGTVDAVTPRSHDQFHRFFWQWDEGLRATLATNCSAALNTYNDPNNHSRTAVYDVVQCLLDQTPNFRALEMAVASVILGLTPTLIQSLGTTTVQTSILSLRRPALAFFLSIGSPVVNPLRSTAYMNDVDDLERPVAWYPSRLPLDGASWAGSLVSLAEYLIVLAAVANVSTLAYELGYWSISIMSVGETWLPALWTFLSFVIHMVGMVAFRLRFDVSKAQLQRDRPLWLIRRLWRDLAPVADHQHTTLTAKESPWFHILAWALYIGVTVHTLFGSVVLSSLIFISPGDAVGIAGRYALSAIACRLVAVFELVGMHKRGLRVSKKESAVPSVEELSVNQY